MALRIINNFFIEIFTSNLRVFNFSFFFNFDLSRIKTQVMDSIETNQYQLLGKEYTLSVYVEC